jgi:hypothetical protein
VEAFSSFRSDRGIHPVVGTAEEVAEGVCAQGISGRAESHINWLVETPDARG